MFKTFSGWLYRVSTGWVALGALVIFLIFSALVLPAQSTQAEASGGGAGSPDMSFFYSRDDLYRMAAAYGERGRAVYVRARFTFDLIWPLVYTLFLATALSWLFKRAFPAGSTWRLANLAPVLGALLDYLENVSASLVMLRYPNPTPVVDVLVPIFTLVKWIFVGGSFALLGLGAIAGIWHRLGGRRAEDGASLNRRRALLLLHCWLSIDTKVWPPFSDSGNTA